MSIGLIKHAFVLGAGFGTRLRPLTNDVPKPLMPIFQKPLITFALDHLIAAGVERFVINTHHLAGQFNPIFGDGSYAGSPVRLVHELEILETGGGIKNVQTYFESDPFVVYSGDLLTDLDLARLASEHFERGNDVTLALRNTGLAAGVLLQNGRVTDIRRERSATGFDYANVSVWNPSIFERIPAGKKISFIPVLADWIRQGGRIGGVVLNDGDWSNIGSRNEYIDVHRTIAKGKWRPAYVTSPVWPIRVSLDAEVDPSARVLGCSVVGEGCTVGPEVVLDDTILWPGSQIASQSELRNCIVRSGREVRGIHLNLDI